MYRVFWDSQTLEDLESVSQEIAVQIVKRVDEYLAQDPEHLGKPLSSTYKGFYRYRYGDYRVIYEIIRSEKQINVLKIGHRSEVYRN